MGTPFQRTVGQTIAQQIAQQIAIAEHLLLNHAAGHNHEDNIGQARTRFEVAADLAKAQRNSLSARAATA